MTHAKAPGRRNGTRSVFLPTGNSPNTSSWKAGAGPRGREGRRKRARRKCSQEDSGSTSTRKRPSVLHISAAPADVMTPRVTACYACRFKLVQGLLPEAAGAEGELGGSSQL